MDGPPARAESGCATGDVQDLEDIATGAAVGGGVRDTVVVPHPRRRRGKEPAGGASGSGGDDDGGGDDDDKGARVDARHGRGAGQEDAAVPGAAVVHVKTWGCGHNASDGEYMSGLLAAYGYTLTDDEDKAELWVLNSCAVKGPSEDTFRNAVERGRAAGKKLVLAGCVPQGAPKGRTSRDESIVGVQQIDRVVEVVEETLKGSVVRLLGGKREAGGRKGGGARLDLPKIRRNPLVEVVPIATGCLNQCTYCKTKHARGELGSYHPDEIVSRVASVLEEGVVEVWLTSEDTGAYGRDIGTSLPELLERVLAVMEERPHTRLRLGMTNPPYILEHLDAIARLLQHPNMYCFLHVPVQAVSDEILHAMRREYTQRDFRRVVDTVRAANPDVTVATDIIAGFPGETEADWEETMALCRDYKFPCLYINQFFPRPGTPAAAMPRVDPREVKRRTKALSALFRSYFPHKGKAGRRYTVLCAEESTDKLFFVAHNKSYDQILVPKRAELLGRTFDVVITDVGKFHMMADVVEGTLGPPPPAPSPPTPWFAGGKPPLLTAGAPAAKGVGIRARRKDRAGGAGNHAASADGDVQGSSNSSDASSDDAHTAVVASTSGQWTWRSAMFALAIALLAVDLVKVFAASWLPSSE